MYLKDYLSMPRIMPFPNAIYPGISSPTPPPDLDIPLVNTLKPQYQWQFLSDAKVYSVEVQELNENNSVFQTFISPRISATNFTFSVNLKDGGKYRWRVRALDGEINATNDNRSLSQ